MANIFILDIENTVIDDLVNRNFMEDNCDRIKQFIHKEEIDNVGIVTFFTWGWKTEDEIDDNLISVMLDRLDIPKEKRPAPGNILVKEDSVNAAIDVGWLSEEDRKRALFPGMMGEFGISKISCFFEQISSNVTEKTLNDFKASPNNPLHFWLIDDTVDEFDELTWHGGRLVVSVINPKELV